MRADGYVRVSQVRGREGESFISPDLQRQRIERWCRENGAELGALHEELDRSGGDPTRPKWVEMIRRAEAGETDVVVVARLDRFSRSSLDAMQALKRLRDAGVRFVSVEDGFDAGTPMGRFALQVLMSLAELERERITEGFRTARGRAVQDGIWVAPKVPLGYRRENGRRSRLVVDEAAASRVRQFFADRAAGKRLRECAAELGVGLTSARHMVVNRVYLGEVRDGEAVIRGAHTPLVDEATFQAAQPGDLQPGVRNGRVAAMGVLRGLVFCDGCGYRMTVSSAGMYVCRGLHADGRCPAAAAVKVELLDRHVEGLLEDIAYDVRHPAHAQIRDRVLAGDQVRAAREELAVTESAIESWITEFDAVGLTPQEFQRGLEARRAVRDAARRQLEELVGRGAAPDPGAVLDRDQYSMVERRAAIAQFVDRVTVRKSTRGKWDPVPDRAEVAWR